MLSPINPWRCARVLAKQSRESALTLEPYFECDVSDGKVCLYKQALCPLDSLLHYVLMGSKPHSLFE